MHIDSDYGRFPARLKVWIFSLTDLFSIDMIYHAYTPQYMCVILTFVTTVILIQLSILSFRKVTFAHSVLHLCGFSVCYRSTLSHSLSFAIYIVSCCRGDRHRPLLFPSGIFRGSTQHSGQAGSTDPKTMANDKG